MTIRAQLARCLQAAIVAFGLSFAANALAQDSMQLDLDFRNSLPLGHARQEQNGAARFGGSGQNARASAVRIEPAKRRARWHRHAG